MAVALGKRKRDIAAERTTKTAESDSDDNATARALFQRAFEAKFKPLARTEKKVESVEDEDEDDSVSDDDDDDAWSGFSADDDVARDVEVVQHAASKSVDRDQQRREMKAFLAGKAPQSSRTGTKATLKAIEASGEEGTDAANLKNDHALQRLLKESHLLDASTFKSAAQSTPEGKSRLKALDLRLQDLGSKKSHLTQEKMPLAHRKGIVAKASDREIKRRADAKENGIILERIKSATKSEPKRDRGIGGPGVGKFQGGTLRLSSKDVRSIESSGGRGGRIGRGGKGGRGARRGKRGKR